MAVSSFLPVYQGDANLGIGTGIGVGGADNKDFASSQKAFDNSFAVNTNTQNERLKLLADTQKTIGVLDQEFNVKMFQQKVADRDAMYTAFLNGKGGVEGGALDGDQTYLDGAKKGVYDSFLKWNKNGINDAESAKDFKKQQDNLVESAALLATRKAQKAAQEAEIARMPTGRDKDEKQANLDKWLNGKDADGKPMMPTVWVKLNGYDDPAFMKQAVVDDVVTKSKDGLYSTTSKVFNFDKTFENITRNRVEGNEADKSNSYIHTYWDNLTPNQQQFLIKESEQETADYLAQHPDSKVTPISAARVADDAQGNPVYKLADDESNFAAKWLLLHNPTKSTTAGDEFAFKIWKQKQENSLGWGQLNKDEKEAADAATSILRLNAGILNSSITDANKVIVNNGKTGKNETWYELNDPSLLKQFANMDLNGKTYDKFDAVRVNPVTKEIKLVTFEKTDAVDKDGYPTGEKTIVNNKSGGKNIISSQSPSITGTDWIRQTTKSTYTGANTGNVFGNAEKILNQYGGDIFKLADDLKGDKQENTQQQPSKAGTTNIEGFDIPSGATPVRSKKTGKIIGYELNGGKFKF